MRFDTDTFCIWIEDGWSFVRDRNVCISPISRPPSPKGALTLEAPCTFHIALNAGVSKLEKKTHSSSTSKQWGQVNHLDPSTVFQQ